MSTPIDRGKLRAKVRQLGLEYAFLMLDDALELLSPSQLRRLAKNYIPSDELAPDPSVGVADGLIDEVRRFQQASLAGEYHESFDVTSKNCTERSVGTLAWIATHGRLLTRCTKEAATGDPVEVREAMDILFGLLDQLDDGNDDILFFADEGGSWQAGVDWPRVLPAWFKVLAATATPTEYAGRITALLSRHYTYGRDTMLKIALRIGSKDHRAALRTAASR